MTPELTDSFEPWQDLKFYCSDTDVIFYLENPKLSRPTGIIIRAFDSRFDVERILAIPLNDSGDIEEEQLLFELWKGSIFEGKLTVTRIRLGKELEKLGMREFLPQSIHSKAGHVSRWLANLSDETWRNMAREVLGPTSAEALYRQMFL